MKNLVMQLSTVTVLSNIHLWYYLPLFYWTFFINDFIMYLEQYCELGCCHFQISEWIHNVK